MLVNNKAIDQNGGDRQVYILDVFFNTISLGP